MPTMAYSLGRGISMLALMLLPACHTRVVQQGFGRCEFVSADSAPLGPIRRAASPRPGELRVRAHLRADAAQPYVVRLAPSDAGQPAREVTTDTVATFADLEPGKYKLRVGALAHASRSFEVEMPADSGRLLEVPLRYGGVGICEDGITLVRRPWWSFW